MGIGSISATTYYTNVNGNPNTLAIWWTGTTGTGTHPLNFTTAGDIFTIQNTDNMTLTADWTVAGTIVINSGGTLIRGTNNITCGGLVINGSSTNSNGGTFTINGNVSGTTGTITAGGTQRIFKVTGDWTFSGSITNGDDISVTMNGTGNQLLSGTISNGTNPAILIINNASGIVSLGSNINTGGGTFTMSAGTFDPGLNLLSATTWVFTAGTLRVGGPTWASNYSGAITEPVAGTIEYDALGNQTVNNVNYPGNLIFSGSGIKTLQTPTTSIGGNLTLSGTASATTVAALAIGGNLTVGDGTTFTVAGYNFTVTGITTIGAGLSGNLTLNNITGTKLFKDLVTISTNATWNNSGNSPVEFRGGITSISPNTFTAGSGIYSFTTNSQALTGTFTIPNVTVTGVTLTNSNSLTVGTALSGTGGLTQSAGATLNLTGTSGITTLTATNTGNTVNFNGGGQTVNSNNYYNLTLSIGGTKTLQSGTTSINGTFSLTDVTVTAVTGLTIGGDVILDRGFIFNTGGFTHNISGNWTQNSWGTFTPGTGSINFTGNNSTINGTQPTQTFNNITISKTAGQTLSVGSSVTTLNVTNDITLVSGSFAPSAVSMVVSGNWINNGGSLTGGTGIITMKGSGKSIGGTSPTTFSNLYINNNAGGILLGVDQFVNGTLTLTNGLLKLGAFNMTMGVSSTAISSGADNFRSGNLIIASGTGQLRKVFSGNTSYIYPIGDASTYSPMTLNFTQGTYDAGAYAGVNVTNTNHPQNTSPNYLKRFWSVSQSGIHSFLCNVAGTYNYGDIQGIEGLQNAVELKGALPWISYSPLSGYTLTANGVNAFGDFTGMGLQTLVATPATLNGFTYIHYYGPSDPPKQFNITAQNLTTNLIVTAPADFEVSLTYSGGYGSSLSLAPSSGTVNSQIYVHLKAGLAVGNYSNENIVCTTPGLSPVNVLLTNATVTAPTPCTPTGDGSGYSITLVNIGTINNVTAKPSGYSDYSLTQSTNVILGNTYPITVKVNTNGSNRVGVRVWFDWNNGGFTYNSGYQSFDLGIATNQTNGSTANCPLNITVPLTASLGPVKMRVACEYYNSPGDNDYCANGAEYEDYTLNIVSPTITTNATLTGFSYPFAAGPSSEQNFTVGGTYLTNDVIVTPPATGDYEISTTSGGSFIATNPIILHPTSNTVANTTIYVRLKAGLAAGSYPTENIVSTSTGATSKKVVCSGTVVANYYIVTTGTVTGSPFCAGSPVSVPFSITGNYNPANVFTAQLSNASGNFATPVTIGTSAAAGTISGTIPAGTITGTGYKIRVTSSSPVATMTDNGTNLTINATLPVSVSIAASANLICLGTTVTFTATPTNGGTTPSYQWKVNGINSGTNSATFIYTPANNDAVTCVLTNTTTLCTNPATSNTVTMTVNSLIANNTFDFSAANYGTVCASVAENANAILTASAGSVFIYVGFASFGTPNGTCNAFTLGSCHQSNSQSITESYLLGYNSASIPATNEVFVDPCSGTSKKLSVQAYYSTPTIAGNSPGTITGMVPTGGNGTYTYYWESSTTGSTSGFSAAAGTNNAKDYTPGILTQSTWFRRTVMSGGCSNTSSVIKITVVIPTITASIASLTGFTYVSGSGPSTEQSFTVSGINLNTNIIVTPPANFEISTGTGSSFVPVNLITLNVLNSVVASTPIYVRMKAGLLTTPTDLPENIVLTSTGATTQNVACSGSVIIQPVIVISTPTLSEFNYNFGSGPSTSQFFNVSGANLTGNIVITPPANYEISLTSGSGYTTSTLTLTQSGGNVALTPIYIRLISALVVNTYSGSVVLTSSFATTQNVFCSGSVTAPIVTVSTFNLGGFIYTYNTGPSASQFVSVSGLYLTNNLVVTAPASFEICTTAGGAYTSSITLTPTSGSVPATKIYVRLISGLAATSYGPVNMAASSTGAITQNIICSGKVVNSATLIGSVAALKGFMYLSDTGPSGSQTFTLSGSSLTSDIKIAAPSNFEISNNLGSTYTTGSITITKPGTGILNSALIFVRLITGLAVNTYSGNLVITSSPAVSVTIPCSGQVLTTPTITAGATPGASVCIGNTVTLSSTSTGGVTNLYWTCLNGYYSQANNPPVPLSGSPVTATDAGIYTVTGSVFSGVNLLTNGDFELGTVGFGSSYSYVVPSSAALDPEGVYTITGDGTFTTPATVHSSNGFSACLDHTHLTVPGAKHQMVINAASTAGVIVWSESVSVVKNADYQFSYFLESVNSSNPSELQLYVNGVPAGKKYVASTTTCQWNQYFYNYNAGTNNVLQLTLINQNTSAGGNDFALDDMVFQQVFQVQASVNLVVNPVLAPSLTVTASGNPVYTNTPVTFTATPTNGGATPAYQWSVGGVAVMGATSSTYTFNPTNGQVVSCVMTPSLPCATPSTATSSVTMTVNQRSNYWQGSVGANGTDWGTPANWTSGIIPAPGNDVEYATTSNAALKMAINSLQLDQDRTIGSLINATPKSLIIPAGKGLIVNQTITTNGDPGLINIKSSPSSKNGSLIYHNPSDKPVFGTVEMYSLASYDINGPVNGKYKWQYFGIPLSSVVANPTFYGSYVRKWDESGTAISNHWVSLDNYSTLLPFFGYEITQKSATTIVFQGQLVNSNSNFGQLAVTPTALFPGEHIFANPYTAAIDIRQLDFGSDTEATVYLYNTGSYSDWLPNGQSSPGINPGQYTSVPKSTAGNGGIPRQIPSMQGFMVKAMPATTTPNCTFGITYNSVAMTNSDAQRAPGIYTTTDDSIISTRIDLKGTNYGDRMWLFTQPGCTPGFDNGWDGRKMAGDALTPQLFAIEPDGNYQVDALNDINNTYIGFQAGTDTEYTLTFTHSKISTNYSAIYLVDLVDNKTVEITQSGSTYLFVSETTPAPVKRFMIATRNIEKDAPDANSQLKVFSSGHVVFVQNLSSLNGEMLVYDMTGRILKRAKFSPLGVTDIQLAGIPGAYVISAATSNEKVSKRVIIGN